MRFQIIGRLALAGSFALAALAQAPAPAGSQAITLVPALPAGSVLTYSIAIHSAIGTRAQLDTSAQATLHVLAGAAPGRFEAELRFTQYTTKVQAADPADQKSLATQAAATDQAAQSMSPIHVRVDLNAPGSSFTVISRPAGSAFDQPVQMLSELARMDTLPAGPTAVGARWSRVRTQPIPTLNFSLPLTLDCQLTAVGTLDGQPSATIVVHSHASGQLPPGSFPGTQQLAAEGLVPEVTIAFETTATSQYRLPQTILEAAHSETHNNMLVRLVGPSPQAQTSNTDINSTATLKLVSIKSHT